MQIFIPEKYVLFQNLQLENITKMSIRIMKFYGGTEVFISGDLWKRVLKYTNLYSVQTQNNRSM